jgi:hypothetical protein
VQIQNQKRDENNRFRADNYLSKENHKKWGTKIY